MICWLYSDQRVIRLSLKISINFMLISFKQLIGNLYTVSPLKYIIMVSMVTGKVYDFDDHFHSQNTYLLQMIP